MLNETFADFIKLFLLWALLNLGLSYTAAIALIGLTYGLVSMKLPCTVVWGRNLCDDSDKFCFSRVFKDSFDELSLDAYSFSACRLSCGDNYLIYFLSNFILRSWLSLSFIGLVFVLYVVFLLLMLLTDGI